MDGLTRRKFLESTATTGVGLSAGLFALSRGRRANADSANDRVRLAVVGLRGRGGVLASKFSARPDCEVAYLCDVDETVLPQRAAEVEQQQHRAPKVTSDFRRALDDKSI